MKIADIEQEIGHGIYIYPPLKKVEPKYILNLLKYFTQFIKLFY